MKKKVIGYILSVATSICLLSGCGKTPDTDNTGNLPSQSGSQKHSEASQQPSEETQSGDDVDAISMEKFLHNAKMPLGSTLYVWGGGWNEADDGAGTEAVTLGPSPRWKSFYEENDASYDYHDTKYQIHDGLDCSGYLGWVVYNTFENENGKAGYVMSSTQMAETFAGKGWGTYTAASEVTDWKVGDVMSMKGHVWIALGTCDDQSVLLLHASPPGVRLCGTLMEDGSESKAVELARKYTKANYPDWHGRYPSYGVDRNYLSRSSQMRWNTETFSDALSFQSMTPEELLGWMFD